MRTNETRLPQGDAIGQIIEYLDDCDRHEASLIAGGADSIHYQGAKSQRDSIRVILDEHTSQAESDIRARIAARIVAIKADQQTSRHKLRQDFQDMTNFGILELESVLNGRD